MFLKLRQKKIIQSFKCQTKQAANIRKYVELFKFKYATAIKSSVEAQNMFKYSHDSFQ